MSEPPSVAPSDRSAATASDTAPRRRVDARVVKRAAVVAVVLAAVVAASYLVPLPSVASVRSWGEDLGPWFVVLFFVAYAVVTIAPIPRSTFTVMSGVLFGPLVGFVGAMIASTVAAMAAFWLVRGLGRRRVQPFLTKPIVRSIEYRLSRRGWLAVGSIRLIAACPFSVANYCSALSSVRPLPYLVASVLGMAPGTAAVVFIGDALTGQRNPLLLGLSALFFSLGIIGLVLDARLPVRSPDADPTTGEDPAAMRDDQSTASAG
ncbi:TVP38/TMEM64 family protein [Gordonia soli]|uniref:TVP38/TMEM64 family membrane protein n=1 Tax=Gordonia soli NBRC 108243 TaxID=1223545 RepID=M0QJT8_9ACTN|nr:TVP38/TMEM64 family protein [Gordonia soli]GAC68724.1 hypothetical protein GS4_18_00120 [Gordonia soli NBRC 108243]